MSRCWRRASPPSPSSTISIIAPDGSPYAEPAELAGASRPRPPRRDWLTLLPVFYAHATFGGAPPQARAAAVHQRSRPASARLVDGLPRAIQADDGEAVGIAPHQPARGDAERIGRAPSLAAAIPSTSTPPSR